GADREQGHCAAQRHPVEQRGIRRVRAGRRETRWDGAAAAADRSIAVFDARYLTGWPAYRVRGPGRHLRDERGRDGDDAGRLARVFYRCYASMVARRLPDRLPEYG